MLYLYSKGAALANYLFVLTETFNKLNAKSPDNQTPSTDKAQKKVNFGHKLW